MVSTRTGRVARPALSHWELLRLLRDGVPPFDFIHLDGGHFIDAESGAWALASRLPRPGGVMLFDDLSSRGTRGFDQRPMTANFDER